MRTPIIFFHVALSVCPLSDCPNGNCDFCTSGIEWLNGDLGEHGFLTVNDLNRSLMAKVEGYSKPIFRSSGDVIEIETESYNKKDCANGCNQKSECNYFIYFYNRETKEEHCTFLRKRSGIKQYDGNRLNKYDVTAYEKVTLNEDQKKVIKRRLHANGRLCEPEKHSRFDLRGLCSNENCIFGYQHDEIGIARDPKDNKKCKCRTFAEVEECQNRNCGETELTNSMSRFQVERRSENCEECKLCLTDVEWTKDSACWLIKKSGLDASEVDLTCQKAAWSPNAALWNEHEYKSKYLIPYRYIYTTGIRKPRDQLRNIFVVWKAVIEETIVHMNKVFNEHSTGIELVSLGDIRSRSKGRILLRDVKHVMAFKMATTCSAPLGIQTNGNVCSRYSSAKCSVIKLSPECVHQDPIAIQHEFMHSLGFFHEHQRQIRDEYINVNENNIADQYKFAFTKYAKEETEAQCTPYDMTSIMHYDPGCCGEGIAIDLKTKGVKQLMNHTFYDNWEEKTFRAKNERELRQTVSELNTFKPSRTYDKLHPDFVGFSEQDLKQIKAMFNSTYYKGIGNC